MKNFFTLILAGTCLYSTAQSTIPNNGLESWSMVLGMFEDPVNWPSSNYLTVSGSASSMSVFKTTDSFSGNAARLVSVPLTNNPLSGMIPDTVAIIISGTINPINATLTGIPFSAQPANLQFYAKYNPNGADTANIAVVLTKWNTTTGSRDTLARGLTRIEGPVGSYTQYQTQMIYSTPGVAPDSAMIMVASSGFIRPKAGSELFVDQFSFTGGDVGVMEIPMAGFATRHYPNPASEGISIDTKYPDSYNVQVMDITGKTCLRMANQKGKTGVDLKSLSPGIYFCRLADVSGKTIYTGKIQKIN